MNRVPGVIDAHFSYEEGSGTVTYDPDETDPETFIRELADKTGFQASVAPASSPTGRR